MHLTWILAFVLSIQIVSMKCGLLNNLYDTIGKEMLYEIVQPSSKPLEETTCSSQETASTISRHDVQQEKGSLLLALLPPAVLILTIFG